jgi:hypothetical protein
MNASTRIYEKMANQLYKKVGRKYVPTSDPFAYEGLREGWWLVKVSSGCTSIRQALFPYKAELEAAAKDKEDAIMDIIREATEAKPKEGIPLSEEARADWTAFIAKHGKEFSVIYYPSHQEVATKIMDKILGRQVYANNNTKY